MADLSSLDPRAPDTRRYIIWGVAGGAVLIVLMTVFVVLYSSNRSSAAPTSSVPALQPTTTLGGSRVGSGQVGGVEDEADTDVVYSSCLPIKQSFPLPDRTCLIGVPPDVGIDEKMPAIVLLHGFNTTSGQTAAAGAWDQHAVDDRLVIVRPEGMFSSWNAGGCCGFSQSSATDDIGYLDAVLEQVARHPNVDASKVFMVGESNGGMMAYNYACNGTAPLAGIASVGGTRVRNCEPSTPIQTFHAHGTDDEAVPYEGGQSLVSWVIGVTFPGLERSMQQWADTMACGAKDVVSDANSVSSTVWRPCREGASVRLDTIDGGPHTWFRGQYDATSQILDFFGIA